MKVWEKLNELKGTDASRDTIYRWCYDNRILPFMVEECLELDEGVVYPQELIRIIENLEEKHGMDQEKVLEEWLDTELEETK